MVENHANEIFGPQLRVHSGIVLGLKTKSLPTSVVIQDTHTALFRRALCIKATNLRQKINRDILEMTIHSYI